MSQSVAASFTLPALALGLLVTATPACTLEKQDDGEEFREAVPSREALTLPGPDADTDGAGVRGASIQGAASKPQGRSPAGGAEYAKWYGFTRAVRGGVNFVTATVLGSVWAIVHTDPMSVKEGEATWGPYTDALEPVAYRFVVTRIAEHEYDYVLEGRPKRSKDEGDYRVVLKGHGYGKQHRQHGQGDFTIDLSAAHELDPAVHPDDSGRVHIAHRLPRDLGRLDAQPRTIEAQVTPDPAVNRESFSLTSQANADGTGSLHVEARSDVDDSKATELEDVSVNSRWNADGAGRADIVIAGGDIPADPGVVSAVECWATDFTRAYYDDSVDFAPTEGDATACVYRAP